MLQEMKLGELKAKAWSKLNFPATRVVVHLVAAPSGKLLLKWSRELWGKTGYTYSPIDFLSCRRRINYAGLALIIGWRMHLLGFILCLPKPLCLRVAMCSTWKGWRPQRKAWGSHPRRGLVRLSLFAF